MYYDLTGPQRRQLREALTDAFPREGALRRMVREELDENLASIVNSTALDDMVFELIEWAHARDKLNALIQGAQNTNPDNRKLKAFVEQFPPVPPASLPTPPVILPTERVGDTFPKWRALLNDLAGGQCTPILGPGLLEPLLGPPREMARRWAASYNFPLAPTAQEDLPQVAQYLATIENANTVRSEFRKYLTAELRRRHSNLIPNTDHLASLDDLLYDVAAVEWSRDPATPYQLLAALPFPIYITTNPDNLLVAALRAAGRTPEVELCRWVEDERWPPSLKDREPDYEPTPDRPLVYHLFGRLHLPFSLVLKEDDYFDYLVGVTRLNRYIPSAVRAALTDSGLLFLGFHLDDWSFRVLFRSILSQGTPDRRAQYTHVAVQIDPQDAAGPDATAVRRYLENYFEHAAVTVYWGRVEQFLCDFQANWVRYEAEGR